MTPRERQLLGVLATHERLALGSIASLMGISRSQASRLANGLVARKLVTRHPPSSGDLRFVLFAITRTGRRAEETTREAVA